VHHDGLQVAVDGGRQERTIGHGGCSLDRMRGNAGGRS
jgi:hypothetical protein